MKIFSWVIGTGRADAELKQHMPGQCRKNFYEERMKIFSWVIGTGRADAELKIGGLKHG